MDSKSYLNSRGIVQQLNPAPIDAGGAVAAEIHGEIKANAEAISTNAEAISANAAAIETNTAAIEANTAAIGTNAAAIEANTAAIETNAAAISTNTEAISANTAAIETNAAAIETNAAAIETNAAAISTNAAAIETNAAAIATLEATAATHVLKTGDATEGDYTNTGNITNTGVLTNTGAVNITGDATATNLMLDSVNAAILYKNSGLSTDDKRNIVLQTYGDNFFMWTPRGDSAQRNDSTAVIFKGTGGNGYCRINAQSNAYYLTDEGTPSGVNGNESWIRCGYYRYEAGTDSSGNTTYTRKNYGYALRVKPGDYNGGQVGIWDYNNNGWLICSDRDTSKVYTGGTANVTLRGRIPNEFASNRAGNGYQKLMNGLIIQWGRSGTASVAAGGGTGTVSVTFPIAFPTACLRTICSFQSAYKAASCGASSFTSTKGVFSLCNWDSSAKTMGVDWIAFGY